MSIENLATDSHEIGHAGAPATAFDFDPKPYAEEFRANGYAHIKNGVMPEFIDLAKERLEEYQSGQSQFMSEWEFKNKTSSISSSFPKITDCCVEVWTWSRR